MSDEEPQDPSSGRAAEPAGAETPQFPVVGVGASAGGLEAIGELLRHLPPDTGMAFIFVQHLDPSHPSLLAPLLARSSAIPVHEARDGVEFSANCAYVIPPNSFLAVIDGVLRLSPRPAGRGAPMPIDYFFMSLAEQVGDLAIGIVLSGTGSDGASGLLEVKARGGLTFAQDEQTANYSGMPRAAVAAGAVDFVLPPEGIARELARIARAPGTLRGASGGEDSSGGVDLRRVLALLRRATGADFSYYKYPTLFRRLTRRMLLLNVTDLAAYVAHVGEHPEELTALHDDILINVTSFFRDEEMLAGLVEHVFHALVKDRPANDAIRIWVPGCSTGEEAYSIAIALLEFFASANVHFPAQIFATDLSEPAIARSRAGLYAEDLAISPERLARFFIKTERGYQVSKTIRDMCVFAKHNLLTDPPFSQLDLVSCRNVLIYLRPEYQRQVFEIFHFALKPSGFLMLGRSESANGATELFAILDKTTRLYVKKPAARGPVRLMRGLEAPFLSARSESSMDPSGRLDDVVRRADAALVHVTPPAVVIDDDAEIVHFRGDTKPYLAPPPGPPTANLFKLARHPLQLDLRAVVDEARRTNAAARRGPISLSENGRESRVVVEATPLAGQGGGRHFVVLFNDDVAAFEARPSTADAALEATGGGTDAAEAQRQLRETRLHLEGAIHELESLNEEYRSAHEEALSVNEELQSSNEELETAKEELQSANEELTTVNDELQARSSELTRANNDLTNVMSHMHMPVILVVGSDLRLRRFTPIAMKVLDIRASDIGRPITEFLLSSSMSSLPRLIVETMETMQPHEQDVQDRDGRWYALRVRPYRTHDAKIDGAVVMLIDVDDLRRALGAAQEAQRYADAIVSTVREPLVVLDEKLTVLRANRGFYETFEISPEQSTGRRLFDIGNHQWDVDRLRVLLERVISQHKSFEHFEMMHDSPGGSRALLLNARRIDDESGRPSRILLAMEDVTERRRVEADREERLSVAEHARDEAQGVGALLRHVQTITDMRLLKLPFDDLLQEILNRVRDTVGGDTAVILLCRMPGEEDGADTSVLRARAAIGIEDDVRMAIRVPIGNGFAGRIAADHSGRVLDDVDYDQLVSPYFQDKGIRSLVGVPLLTEGGLLGVLHVGSVEPRKFGRQDFEILTLAAERIAHAVEVAARRDSERRARAAAEEANRAKDEFLALLSHELRNPLSAISNSILAARLDPGGRERSLEIAGRQSAHLTRLVDDLLDVARITQGKIRLRREPIRFQDAAARAIERARALIDSRGHTLSVECFSERAVDADPARLEQVIENLLTNAAKYTPPGGCIDVICEPSGDQELLRVRDNGIGIAPEMLPRVFDLFAQEAAHLDRTQGGLGIGLTVVRRLVELHGGQIEARSEGVDRGSEFVVRLPALPAPKEVADGSVQPVRFVAGARVLIVEDNPDAAESLQVLLELSGHSVRVASDGPEALREVERDIPDIALIDIGLPGISGYELVRLLRDKPGIEKAALVALSGYGRDEDKEKALQAGFHHHLTKPVEFDRLQALVAELLNVQRHSR